MDRHHADTADRAVPALSAAVLGFFVITLDAVVVNVALPSIRDDLGGGIAGLQWVVDGYTLMFAALLLLARTARSPHHNVPFDWIGQVAAVVAMGGLTYGAIEVGATGFTAPRVLTAFAIAVVALAAFLAIEARGVHPMIPLHLFRNRTVSVAMAVGFAFIVGYYGLPFVMSLYLQQVRGLSSLATGLAFLPMMLIGALLTPVSARIAERLRAWRLIVSGLVLMMTGLVLLAVLPASAPVWTLALLMVPVGVAGPLVMPPMTGLLLNSVPGNLAGTASGVFNTSRQIGGALAVAVFGALLASGASFMQGLRTSLLIAAGVALLAGAASLLLPRGQRGRTDMTSMDVQAGETMVDERTAKDVACQLRTIRSEWR